MKYEEAAEFVTVTGWSCKTCRRFYGCRDDSKHIASWCCCTDRPCETPECTGRAERSYTKCPGCLSDADTARFLAKPRVEWDGVTPIVTDNDHFFFEADDLACYLNDLDVEDLASVRLEVCKEIVPPEFSMSEFLCDVMPEDGDLGTNAIDKIVNDWIDLNRPISWIGSGKVPSNESVLRHTGITIDV